MTIDFQYFVFNTLVNKVLTYRTLSREVQKWEGIRRANVSNQVSGIVTSMIRQVLFR
jgi:hypothetical protein